MPGNNGSTIWPTPLEGTGQASGGWFGSIWDGFATAVGGGAVAGFGLGDAGSGMAGNGAQAPVALPILDNLYQGAVDAVAGQYPGYGVFWTYDTREGVGVTQEGWVALAVAGVALWWVLK